MLNQFNQNAPDRSIPPFVTDISKYNFDLLPFINVKLDNNTNIYIFEGGNQNIINTKLVFDVGTVKYKNIIIPNATNELILNGTNQLKAKQIHNLFEVEGISVNQYCGKKLSSINLSGLTEKMNFSFPVLYEILTDSNYPEEEINIYKNLIRKIYEQELEHPDLQADKLIKEFVYGKEHPYSTHYDLAMIDNFTQFDLQECYQNNYCFGSCSIFLTGAGIHQYNIINALNNSIGKLPFNHYLHKNLSFNNLKFVKRKEHINYKSKSTQTQIRLGCPTINIFHEDFYYLKILNIILGGYFGSRLMKSIREELGDTYGIHSEIFYSIDQPCWIISSSVTKSEAGKIIARIGIEMERLKNEYINFEELHQARNYILGNFLQEISGVFSIADTWQNYILNSIPIEYFYRSTQIIKKITPEEIRNTAQKYLGLEKFHELTLT